MPPTLRYVDRGRYAGLSCSGGPALELPTELPLHLDRAFYLAAALEAPRWGAVQSYDGAGLSGGPFHFVAMFPRSGKQGPLWGLLRRVELTQAHAPIQALWDALRAVGWFVARDGRLRDWKTGAVVRGSAIRSELAPPNGHVPRRGTERARAERWARLFFDLLSHPATFDAQREYAIEWLMTDPRRQERRAYARIGDPHGLVYGVSISPELDLALATYHAFAVNAPAPAMTCLATALDDWDRAGTTTALFARRLVWGLGRNSYGNWKVRYARTRRVAMRMWPRALFVGESAIMPAELATRRPLRAAPPLIG